MRTPGCRKPIMRRQLRVRVAGDIEDRKVVRQKRECKTAKRDRHAQELSATGRRGDSHPGALVSRCADQRQSRLNDGYQERNDKSKLSDLRNHKSSYRSASVFPASFASCRAFSIDWAASTGM